MRDRLLWLSTFVRAVRRELGALLEDLADRIGQRADALTAAELVRRGKPIPRDLIERERRRAARAERRR